MSPETGKEPSSSEASPTTMTTAMEPTTTKQMPIDGTAINCDTTFCKEKANILSAIFQKTQDPCDNFYAYICSDWKANNKENQPYDSADDALSGTMEEMAVAVFTAKFQQHEFMPLFNLYGACMEKGVVKDEELKTTLKSLDVDVTKGEAATIDDVLRAAATLLLKLDNAPLMSLQMNMDPRNSSAKLIAFEEGDCLVSRMDAMHKMKNNSLTDLACKFVTTVLLPGSQEPPLCTALAAVAIDLAKMSTLASNSSERMFNYLLAEYSAVSMFRPMLDKMTGVKKYTEDGAMIIIKNPGYLKKVKHILKSSPADVYAYMAFHTTVYLSPFLEDKDAFWEPAMFLITRRKRSRAVTKSRLCLRLAEKVLPSLTMVAIERAATVTPLFSELMADVIAEEVRSAFIDQVMDITRVDMWTKHVLVRRAQSLGLHSFYPARYSMNLLVRTKAKEIGAKVQWKNNPLEYFLGVSEIMAADWASKKRHLLVKRRREFSLFDTDCQFDAQKNAVVMPLAFFDLSVPTSPSERMFHIPRIGPRLISCLFRATFATNFFRPDEYFWTEYSSSNFESTAKCLEGQYKKQRKGMSMFAAIEENAGLQVALQAYQNRLFSKKYLQLDYRLEGLRNVTAEQLFFAFYAMSLCGSSAKDASNIMVTPEYRVNVPLMNSPDFARSFNCDDGKPMNPSNKCKFWD
ncbi:neprilysin-2-like [Haemaphysalis longicornis]